MNSYNELGLYTDNYLNCNEFLNQLDNGVLKMIWTYIDKEKNSVYAHNGYVYYKGHTDKYNIIYDAVKKEEVINFLIIQLRRNKLNKLTNNIK